MSQQKCVPEHRENRNMSRRRYVFGEVMVPSCEALFKFLDPVHKNTRCNTCFKWLKQRSERSEVVKCECKNARYCDQTCSVLDFQRGHYQEHDVEIVRYFETWGGQSKTMLFRLYALLNVRPDFLEKNYTMYNGEIRNFNGLMAHFSMWKCNPIVRSVAEDLSKALRREGKNAPVDYLVKLMGVFMTNALPICDNGEVIGHGIFMECTSFDHSCKPSANCLTVDAKCEIRATDDIEVGMTPTISYIDMGEHRSTYGRRKALKDQYCFDCECQKCIQEALVPFNYEPLRITSEMFRKQMDFSVSAATLKANFSSIEAKYYEHVKILRTLFCEFDMVVIRFMLQYVHVLNMCEKRDLDTLAFRHKVAYCVRKAAGNDALLLEIIYPNLN